MADKFKHLENDKKVKFRLNLVGGKNFKWVLSITLISFFISAILSVISSTVLERIHSIIAFILVFFIILINIIFDIIGIAVTSAEETPFHAMASRKYFGAKQSILLIRNANKVSSVCNDVVGDIGGVISGTASAIIVLNITFGKSVFFASLITIIVTGLVAALTIGGKAIGKTIAIQNSNYIIYKVGKVLAITGYGKRDKKNTKGRKKNEN